MAKKTITIDPVTRIEGHLKVEAVVDGGEVKEARCTGVMFRGFELFLKGRDPRDAQRMTQRVCGVCPTAHATASTFALDNAFGLDEKIPENGRIMRNLILASNFLQSHVLHFYHLAALDFVDVTAAADYSGNDSDLLSVRRFLERGQLEPFVPRYEGDYRLPADVNKAATAHYVQALRIRRKAQEMLAIFGGKMPHNMGIVPGGVTAIPSVDKITAFHHAANEIQAFINNVYVPDVLAVAGVYSDYFAIGGGASNFLTYGVFNAKNGNHPVQRERFLPQGIVNGSLEKNDVDESLIREDVTHSWYDESGGNTHPSKEDTVPSEDKKEGYSWLKSPRYDGQVAEVGPLASILSAYLSGHAEAKAVADTVMSAASVKPTDLLSVCGRHAARAIEAKLIADALPGWVLELQPGQPAYVDYELPDEAVGVGMTNAPRGALGHWIRIKDKKIENYQLVVPTTWNASPKDSNDNPGPIEQAIMGTKIKDDKNPYEIVRIVRSFDPCLACSVHTLDAKGRNLAGYRVS
jgi:hydrogenase large subunit